MMKKVFRNYLGIWATLLVLFNVIAFVSVGWSGQEKYTASFWVGYAVITVSFVGQLVCAWNVLREENIRKLFYHISVFRISYIGLFASFIVGGLCMLISPLPYWIGIIACSVVLAVTIIAALKSSSAVNLVEEVDKRVTSQTSYIVSLRTETETLLSRAKTDVTRQVCKKVCEAARYSDPVSGMALRSVEEQITEQMKILTAALAENDEEAVVATAEEVVLLIGERNRKCKALK